MDKINQILAQRRQAEQTGPAGTEQEAEGKFFLIPAIANVEEKFLELRFKTGVITLFPFEHLTWANYDPDSGYIDLNFNDYWVAIKGRGLKPLFHGIKTKQVAWIREADSDMQDHKDNENFIEEITVTPPEGFGEEPGE